MLRTLVSRGLWWSLALLATGLTVLGVRSYFRTDCVIWRLQGATGPGRPDEITTAAGTEWGYLLFTHVTAPVGSLSTDADPAFQIKSSEARRSDLTLSTSTDSKDFLGVRYVDVDFSPIHASVVLCPIWYVIAPLWLGVGIPAFIRYRRRRRGTGPAFEVIPTPAKNNLLIR